MSIIRYPGSKAKLTQQIVSHLPLIGLHASSECLQYVEPFFGSGAFGFRVLKTMSGKNPVWINDIDPAMAALWRAVRYEANELCRKVQAFKPSVDAFYEFKERDGLSSGSDAEDGFRKVALHRMSVSGFGAMSGGPIGGRNQEGKDYTVDCRWNPSSIKKSVQLAHQQLRRFSDLQITCLHFRDVIPFCGTASVIYADPPYYEKGSQLYKHSMTDAEHAELAALLKPCKAHWVLSYDDHPRIRELYSWAEFHDVFATYSNATFTGAIRPKNREVVIVRQAA